MMLYTKWQFLNYNSFPQACHLCQFFLWSIQQNVHSFLFHFLFPDISAFLAKVVFGPYTAITLGAITFWASYFRCHTF